MRNEMAWNKERYLEDLIYTFKSKSKNIEGINLLERDFLEPETIEEECEESKEKGTLPRELVEPVKESNYMWKRINNRNNKK